MKNILNKALIVLLAAVLLTPLMASTAFTDPMLIPKMLFFQITMGILLVLAALNAFVTQDSFEVKLTRSQLMLMLFVLWVVLRTVFSSGSTCSNLFMITWVLLVPFHFLVRHQLRLHENNFRWLAFVLLSVGIIEAGYGLLQYFEFAKNPYSSFGATGTYVNPGPYAILHAAILPFALAVILKYPEAKRLRKLAFIAIGLIILTLPLTESRTAWLAALGSCFLVIVFYYQESIKRWFTNSFRVMVVALIMTGLLVVAGWNLYHYKEGSATGRLFIYQRGLEVFMNDPISGVGFDNFSVAYHDAQSNYFKNKTDYGEEVFNASNVEYAFNEYLQMLVEIGSVGLLIFVTLLFFTIRSVFSVKNSQLHLPGLGILCSILISALFSYPFHEIPMMVLFVLSITLISTEDKYVFKYTIKSNLVRALSIFLIVASGYFLYDRFTYRMAEKEWKSTYMNILNGNVDRGLNRYQHLYSALRQNKLFLYNYGVELGMSGNYEESIKILLETSERFNDADVHYYLGLAYWASGQFDQAESHLIKSINIVPYKFLVRYKLMELYMQQGKTDQLKEQAQTILSLKVKVPSGLVDEIKNEARKILSEAK